MSIRDLNKELLRAVQKQDLDEVVRIIQLNDDLSRKKASTPASSKKTNILRLLKLMAATKKEIERN